MKSRSARVWFAILLAVALIVFANRGRIQFDWAVFWRELRHVDWRHIVAGVGLIYVAIWLRAQRWSVLIRGTKRVSVWALVGPQLIGFTAVALFGRGAWGCRSARRWRCTRLSERLIWDRRR